MVMPWSLFTGCFHFIIMHISTETRSLLLILQCIVAFCTLTAQARFVPYKAVHTIKNYSTACAPMMLEVWVSGLFTFYGLQPATRCCAILVNWCSANIFSYGELIYLQMSENWLCTHASVQTTIKWQIKAHRKTIIILLLTIKFPLKYHHWQNWPSLLKWKERLL